MTESVAKSGIFLRPARSRLDAAAMQQYSYQKRTHHPSGKQHKADSTLPVLRMNLEKANFTCLSNHPMDFDKMFLK